MIQAVAACLVILVLTAGGIGYSWGRGRGEEDRGALAEQLCRARLRARVLEQELERRAGVDVRAWSALANGSGAEECPTAAAEVSLVVETTGAHEFGAWLRERIADTDRFMAALDEEIPG